jgi:hypothetical protein
MRISSAKKPVNRTAARNSFLINQLATPGLGSLMAGRWIAGTGQIALALIGFTLVIAWFVLHMSQVIEQFNGESPSKSVAWLWEAGAAIFVASWLWALVTSVSLLREAPANETAGLKTEKRV